MNHRADTGGQARARHYTGPHRSGGMGIFATVLLLASLIGGWLTIDLHRGSALLTPPNTGPADRAVIIIIDGATPSDVSLVPMPNLHALIKHGTSYSNAWLGQMEPNPAASGAAIGTGTLPRTNGVIGPAWTDPETGGATHTLDSSQVQLGSIDQVMESHGVPALAARLKTMDSGARILAVGGAGCQGPAAAGSWLADYILCATQDGRRWAPASVVGHRPPSGPLNDISWSVPVAAGPGPGATIERWSLGQQDDWVGRYAVTAMRVTRPTLTIVDFPEIGLVGPYVTSDQRRLILGALMSGIDRSIGNIESELRRERLLHGTLFVVTSGETVTPFSDTVPRKVIQDAVQAAGAQTNYLNTDGMAWIGLTDPAQALPVAQSIDAKQILNVDAIYYRSQRGDSWTYQPEYLNPELPSHFGDAGSYLLDTIASNASPDVVVVYAPRVGTAGQAGRYLRAGYISGMQWGAQHIPLILSGQGVFPGAVSSYPARLVDIAPTIEAILGMQPARGDGVVLADSMYNPPSGSLAQQTAAAPRYQTIVSALLQRLRQLG